MFTEYKDKMIEYTSDLAPALALLTVTAIIIIVLVGLVYLIKLIK